MKITVQRVWDGGEVTAFCSDEVVGAEMEINEFFFVLLTEAGLIQDKALVQKLDEHIPRILGKMKEQTAKVVV